MISCISRTIRSYTDSHKQNLLDLVGKGKHAKLSTFERQQKRKETTMKININKHSEAVKLGTLKPGDVFLHGFHDVFMRLNKIGSTTNVVLLSEGAIYSMDPETKVTPCEDVTLQISL